MLRYSADEKISVDQFRGILERSTLAARRPVGDPECLAAMLDHADLLVTCWEGDVLVGVARSVTDFSYCCYLSDLAVDEARQCEGIGRELIRQTQARLGPRCRIILLAALAAVDYYPRIGFAHHPQAWILNPPPAP